MGLDLLILFLASAGTALATGLGAVPVFFLGKRAGSLRPLLWGMAAGTMGVASVVGLLMPALAEGAPLTVAVGLFVGVMFLVVARAAMARRDVHVGALRGSDVRSSVLVFSVLFVHSLPEGFAIGTAYASGTVGLGLFVILAIALQNIPEGTAVAIPMAESGFTRSQQFWAAVATSVPQPIGAILAYLLVAEIEALLPVSFAFAAGAMLALVVVDLVPQAFRRDSWPSALAGTAAGALLMLVFAAILGVS